MGHFAKLEHTYGWNRSFCGLFNPVYYLAQERTASAPGGVTGVSCISRFCEAERWCNKIFGQVVNIAYHSHQHHLLHEIGHVVSVSFQILAFTTGMHQVSAVLVAHQEMRAGNIDDNWCKTSVDVLKSHRITNLDHYMHSESMPFKWQRDCFWKMDS